MPATVIASPSLPSPSRAPTNVDVFVKGIAQLHGLDQPYVLDYKEHVCELHCIVLREYESITEQSASPIERALLWNATQLYSATLGAQ